MYSLHPVSLCGLVLRVFSPDCLTSCCVAGRAAPVGSGAGSAAAVSPLMRRWRFWGLFQLRLHHGCEYTPVQPSYNAHTSQITQNNSSFISSVYSLIITVRLKLRQTEIEYTVLLNKSQDNPKGIICQRLVVDGWCVLVMSGMEY